MRFSFNFLACALFAFPLHATPPLRQDTGDAVIFNRERIYIEAMREVMPKEEDRATEEDEAKPEEPEEEDVSDAPPVKEKVRYRFDVEVRPLNTTRLDWFQTLQDIQPGHGVLLTLEPTKAPYIDWSQLLVKTDLLYIRANGVVDTILPNISGADITEDPKPNKPIHALLYLKAGTVDEKGLEPGNRIVSPLFSPSPRVLQ